MTEPTGISAFDLVPPSKPLAPAWTPLRSHSRPSAAEQIAARHAAATREARVKQATDDAMADWRQFADTLAGNPIALAALRCHQPEAGYERVVCDECCESDIDDTVGVEWPCGTFAAMKAAADD